MSTNFFIKNINNKEIPTIRQVLEIGQDISQFDLSEESEDYEEYLDTRLDDIEFILLGQEGTSARGFELSFEKEIESFCIRVFSPCSINDFAVFFNFIRDLGNYLRNAEVITEHGEEYNINTIEEYPYMEHIMNGIEQTAEIFKQSGRNTIEIYCIRRPVSFNKEMFQEIMESDYPVEKFSEIITDIQYIDAFSANQKFFQNKEGSIIGVYSLTETVRTILPFRPAVEYMYSNMVRNEDVTRWEISLVVINGDPDDFSSYETLGRMDYSEFIEKLPKDKYAFIDASNILVEELSREDIENLLA